MSAGPPARRPAPEEVERTVRTLSAHFARDRLTVEEFEGRLDRVYAATSPAELEAVVSDLPELADPEPPAPVPEPPERGLVLALLGGQERGGSWTPPRHLYVLAVWGGAEIDFREATLPPGLTEVTVVACMGGVGVIVPPGLPVETGGLAVMGGFGGRGSTSADPDPSAPRLRIRGVALMGGVDVETRLPGESAREAKRRLRAERRVHRLPGRGERS